MTTAETTPETGGKITLWIYRDSFAVDVEYNTGESKTILQGGYIPGIQSEAEIEWLVKGAANYYGMSFEKSDMVSVYIAEMRRDDSGAEAKGSPTEGE